MKKIFTLILTLLLATALFGCKNQPEAGCEKYNLESVGMGNMIMSGDEARRDSGISDLYLKLYEDGTAEMRISEEIIHMEYADGLIWRADTPDQKIHYTVTDDTLSIVDGAFTYTFTK